jgi:hypothetical protein
MNKIYRISLLVITGIFVGAAALEIPHMKNTTIAPLLRSMNTDEVVADATLIAQGSFTKELGTFRTMYAGDDEMVWTKWKFTSTSFLKGSDETITVAIPGGRYRSTQIFFEDTPTITAGQPVVVALQPMMDHPEYYRIVGEIHGLYNDIDGTKLEQYGSKEPITTSILRQKIEAKK